MWLGLIKVDVDSGAEDKWFGTAEEFVQEPMFAPRKNAGKPASQQLDLQSTDCRSYLVSDSL
jgi:hypothetical protein